MPGSASDAGEKQVGTLPDPRAAQTFRARYAAIRAAQIHRGRVIILARSFGVEPTPEEAARCTTAKGAADVFAARLGAAGTGADANPAVLAPEDAPLHRAALCALREALNDVCRVDRERIEHATPLADVFPRPRSFRWRSVAKFARCKLPPLEPDWASAAVAVLGAWACRGLWDAAWPAPSAEILLATGVAGVLAALVSLLLAMELAHFPGRARTVGSIAGWMVATSPAPLRGGGVWSRAQIDEVTAAVWRLDWGQKRPARLLSGKVLAGIAMLWALVEAFAVLVSLVSIVIT
jgi:hypothetical protein